MTDTPLYRLTVCGIDELPIHRAGGVSHVLSLLDPDAPDPEIFAAYPPHRRVVLRCHDVIENEPDAVAPERSDVERLLAFAREVSQQPSSSPPHLLLHCHAGISRSTAAATLILAQAYPGWRGEAVLREVLRLRPQAWPNLRILELGDGLLRRGGEIPRAAAALYRSALLREPALALAMSRNGRAREVRFAILPGGANDEGA
jgi:predicted protein tyrosine phosphatase